MRKWFRIIAFSAMLAFSPSCYGPFLLTKKIYSWNGKVGDKFVNSAIMWALILVPVYSATLFIDFVILNTVQFWTGTNPLAMSSGEEETQLVQHGDDVYRITARRHELVVEILTGKRQGEVLHLVYQAPERCWYLAKEGKLLPLVREEKDQMLTFYHPDGHKVQLGL